MTASVFASPRRLSSATGSKLVYPVARYDTEKHCIISVQIVAEIVPVRVENSRNCVRRTRRPAEDSPDPAKLRQKVAEKLCGMPLTRSKQRANGV
jgi:hypothetical protein